jgi:hypothetical protein
MLTAMRGLMKNAIQPKVDLTEIRDRFNVICSAYDWTPDKIQLERREYQPLFVYDNMVKGESEHNLIEGCYLATNGHGESHTPNIYTKDKYELWMSNANKYPVAFKSEAPGATMATFQKVGQGPVKSARIKGRLYKVRSDIMFVLDRHKKNGVEFLREKVDVLVPYRLFNGTVSGFNRLSDEYVEDGKAWMYFGKSEFFEPLLDGGFLFSPLPIRQISPERKKTKAWDVDTFYAYYPREPSK